MSSDLLWLIVKNNNRYIIKRNGVTFSKDPYNLTNLNTKTQCGLINTKAVGLISGKKGVKVVLKKNEAFQPKKHHHSFDLRANNFKSGQKKLVNTVVKNAKLERQSVAAQRRAIALFKANAGRKQVKA